MNIAVHNEMALFPETKHGKWMTEEFETDLVSVIVPTYNRAEYIAETLDSVWTQTYRPIEILIVDDGSTDNTQEVVDKWRQSYGDVAEFRVNYFYQENAGVCAARNLGLIESCGEYFQYLDSDDLLPSDRLEKIVKIFKESRCDFIQTGFQGFCSSCGEIIERHYGRPGENQLELALEGVLWPNTLRSTYRRSLVIKTGPWDEKMVTLQDYDYVIRALLQSYKSIAVRDILASARRGHAGRMTEIIKTYEGRWCRLRSESRLCIGVRERDDVSTEAKQAFASRLYSLGFRSKASGWSDLGQKCGELADSLGVELDSLGKRRRMVWRLGKWAGIVYEYAHILKECSLGRNQPWQIKHNCIKTREN